MRAVSERILLESLVVVFGRKDRLAVHSNHSGDLEVAMNTHYYHPDGRESLLYLARGRPLAPDLLGLCLYPPFLCL